jgi:hypothetical protein
MTAEPLDLAALTEKWLNQCGPCDYGMPEYGCSHPSEDYRPVMLDLVQEVERLRGQIESEQHDSGAHRWLYDQVCAQLDEARAEVERLRRVGICGDRLPTLFANTTPLTCDLLAGHDGWHGADNATTFGYPATRCSWTVDEHGPIATVSAQERDQSPGGEP